MCIAGVWDLQTTSFEIPWFLGYSKSIKRWDEFISNKATRSTKKNPSFFPFMKKIISGTIDLGRFSARYRTILGPWFVANQGHWRIWGTSWYLPVLSTRYWNKMKQINHFYWRHVFAFLGCGWWANLWQHKYGIEFAYCCSDYISYFQCRETKTLNITSLLVATCTNWTQVTSFFGDWPSFHYICQSFEKNIWVKSPYKPCIPVPWIWMPWLCPRSPKTIKKTRFSPKTIFFSREF